VAAEHPEVVKQLAAAYEKWWSDCQPLLVNEKVIGPKINPFAEMYYQQFGGTPSAEELARMDPNRTVGEGGNPAKRAKAPKK
jgi:arylsulfatase